MTVLLASIVALSLQSAAAAPPPPPTGVQAMFDSAADAAQRNDLPAALAGYAALERRLAGGKPSRSLALVRLRLGDVLVRSGKATEAEAKLREGLEGMRGQPDPSGEQGAALLQLGTLAEQALDYAAARREYAAALALASEAPADLRSGALAGIARTAMFDDAGAALAAANELLATYSGKEVPASRRAEARTLRGRALLNGGEAKAADTELARAVNELGGLTQRVDVHDMAARSDRAIAAMLTGSPDVARQYLAWTGAGTQRAEFPSVAQKDLPACGGPEGVRPDDVAIVQFAILDDGSVAGVQPIYASRQGQVALAFARAVAKWSWSAEDVKALNPFFRALTRLELRCSTAAERPGIVDILEQDVHAWLAGVGAPAYEASDASAPRAAAAARVEFARREAASGPNATALLPVLVALITNPAVTSEETVPLVSQAAAIAEKSDPPATVRAWLGIREMGARLHAGTPARKRSSYSAVRRAIGTSARAMDAEVARIAADPRIAADHRAAAALLLIRAELLTGARADAEALVLLRSAARLPLPPTDPLRVGALVRLATTEHRVGDDAAARAAFGQSGLHAQECSLVDVKPMLTGDPGSSNDYPTEALGWGFEGWVVTEFDIAADGRTLGQRAVVAYPPFVFGTSATKIVGKARFTPTFRPEGAVGCGGATQRIRFTG